MYRFVVFFLFFVFIASLYRRHLLVLRLLRFVCLLCVVPVSCFMLSLSSSWSSVSFFVSFFRSSSLFFASLRSFVLSLHRRRISYCDALSSMAVFTAACAPPSVVFISMSGFRLSSSSSSLTSLLAISVLLSIGASSSVSEIFQLLPKCPDPGHSS